MCDAGIFVNFGIVQIAFFQEIRGNINIFFCFCENFPAVFRGKHTLPESGESILMDFVLLFEGAIIHITKKMRGGNTADAASDHGRTGFFDAFHVSGGKDSFNGRLAVSIDDRNLAASFWIIFHPAACHFKEL